MDENIFMLMIICLVGGFAIGILVGSALNDYSDEIKQSEIKYLDLLDCKQLKEYFELKQIKTWYNEYLIERCIKI